VTSKIITYPPRVVISGNETILDVRVLDAYLSIGARTKGKITLTTFFIAGNTITFAWNGKTVVFTCRAPGVRTVNSFYTRDGSETVAVWGEKVFHEIATNYELSNDFIISGKVSGSNYEITFEPYVKEATHNLTLSSTGIVTLVNSSYSPDDLYENYKLQLQLLEETTDGFSTVLIKARSAVYPPFIYNGLNAELKYDLSRVLYSDITGHFTFPEDGVRHLHSIIHKYYLQLSFIGDNLPNESLVRDQYFHVLPGKIPQTKEKALNTNNTSIYAELASTKRFLSYGPLTKTTDLYSPEKLYFLFLSAQATATLKITERFTDSAPETRTLATFAADAYSIHEFSIGFQSIKQADYGEKKLSQYDIWIENGSGGMVSEVRTYLMDYTYQRTARYFFFKNSFGVYELFRSTGDAVKSNKIDKDFYTRVVHSKTDRDQSRKTVDIQQTYSMMVNSGYLEDPLNFYYASEFLGSPDVYWLKNDRAYAIQVESSDNNISKTDIDNLHEFEFLVTLDDMDDTFYTEFLPGSELPVLGDFNDDFSDDFNR
jgi:hypothetical protein